MKYIALIAVILALSGCGNWVSSKDIKKAQELCEGNGGIKHLSIFLADDVVCVNGTKFVRSRWMHQKNK